MGESPKLLVWKLHKYNNGVWSPGLVAGRVPLHDCGEKSVVKPSWPTSVLLQGKAGVSERNRFFSISFWNSMRLTAGGAKSFCWCETSNSGIAFQEPRYDLEHCWFWGGLPLSCVLREMGNCLQKGGKQGKKKKRENMWKMEQILVTRRNKHRKIIRGKAEWEKGVFQGDLQTVPCTVED